MSVGAHCDCLIRLLFALEANVHARLGYFPVGLRESCREHVKAYLSSLECELTEELESVQRNLRGLQDNSNSSKSVDDCLLSHSSDSGSASAAERDQAASGSTCDKAMSAKAD